MPATKKLVLQYPPGTGFLLALFPQGFQVIPLYVLSTVVVFGFALLGISYARSRSSDPARGRLRLPGDLPDDQSGQGELFGGAHDGGLRARGLSHRETFPCAAQTASPGFGGARRSPGRPVGQFQIAEPVSVVRIFCCSSSFHSCSSRKMETILQGAVFGVALLAGMAPTLLANAINAGSPLSTTYGAVDVTPPGFSFEHHPELPRRHAIRVARAGGCVDRS